jgi:Ca-activated chloride channel homolog
MAEAIGWGKKPVGWADILALARDKQGWSVYGFPQWGSFKFGHTHPAYSNSGILSLIAENYAAVGKVHGLTIADVQSPKTRDFVSGIENSMVHYGSSTGFFGRKLFDSGPEYLSAAVLYESMVVESYGNAKTMAFPVVALYPKEGTFWSDHPVGIVERDWVTPERREAAQTYINYLLAAQSQQKALAYGFRPGSPDVPVGAPIDAAHGVDPKQPVTTLEIPGSGPSTALERSQQATLGILRRRLENLQNRDRILRENDSDLSRIEAQVQLMRENAAIEGKPASVETEIELASDLASPDLFGSQTSLVRDLDEVRR